MSGERGRRLIKRSWLVRNGLKFWESSIKQIFYWKLTLNFKRVFFTFLILISMRSPRLESAWPITIWSILPIYISCWEPLENLKCILWNALIYLRNFQKIKYSGNFCYLLNEFLDINKQKFLPVKAGVIKFWVSKYTVGYHKFFKFKCKKTLFISRFSTGPGPWSETRNPARNPDFQILNRETGPEKPALCRALFGPN